MSDIDPGKLRAVLNHHQISRNARMSGVFGC